MCSNPSSIERNFMKQLKVWIVICSIVLMLSILYFWTLFVPPLSELEGAESMAQVIVFVPAMIFIPIVLPITWILETIYFSKLNKLKVSHYLFIVLSFVIPILLGIVYFTKGIPMLTLYIIMSIITTSMVIISFVILKQNETL